MTEAKDDGKDGDIELVDSFAARLAEHFDSVQVIVTKQTNDGMYKLVARGRGNYYANYGAVSEWLSMRDEETRIQTRNNE